MQIFESIDMRSYITPGTEIQEVKTSSVLAVSGDNEDFGHKDGVYDILKPSDPFGDFFGF